jgi:transcriptional regulator with XRE-family HTH domain
MAVEVTMSRRQLESYRLDEAALKSAMKAVGLTYRQVAEAAGVNVTSLWRWRQGGSGRRGGAAGRREALLVAEALGLGLDDLWINWGA